MIFLRPGVEGQALARSRLILLLCPPVGKQGVSELTCSDLDINVGIGTVLETATWFTSVA